MQARLVVSVSHSSHPQLASHRIHGKPVLPMALVLEWFARLVRALSPRSDSIQLRDFHIVRGVTLERFEDTGDRFALWAVAGRKGLQLELRDAEGARALRYSALVEAGPDLASAAPLSARDLGVSPWTRPDFYTPDTLFHGPHFHVLRSIAGYAEGGARATLAGVAAMGWPAEPWATDAAAVDGALQLAILCALPSTGPTLPLRIARIGLAGGVARGAVHCELQVRETSPERVVSDITLTGSDGHRLADLVGVEMYQLPGGSAAPSRGAASGAGSASVVPA